MTNILLVDDHQIVRDGIKNLLETNPQIKVVAEATNIEDALQILSKLDIDFLITDISLENSSGLDLLKQARKLYNDLPILILSMHASVDYIINSLDDGANGYLLKDCTKQEMFDAIQHIENHEIYLSKTASQLLLNRKYTTSKRNTEKEEILLTRRELDILKMISNGLTNKLIANEYNLSIRTVDKHRFNILKKFKVKNTAELLKKAHNHNILWK